MMFVWPKTKATTLFVHESTRMSGCPFCVDKYSALLMENREAPKRLVAETSVFIFNIYIETNTSWIVEVSQTWFSALAVLSSPALLQDG